MPRLVLPSHSQLLAGFITAACVYMFFLEPWGHDTWFHLQRLLDIERQFEAGELRPLFAENVAQGRGLAVWVYYSPWIYWPAMLLTSLGASPLIALKLVYCLFLVVCGMGCYRLLRLHTTESPAAFGALLFMTSNYVIGEVFQRSAYAEFLSVALLPFVLLAIHRIILDADRSAGVMLVLLASLMILFHPLSFMNAGCALAAYAAYVVIGWRLPARRVMRLLLPFALALALTAFYWLPAVLEMRYVLGAEGVPTPLKDTFLPPQKYLNFISVNNLGFVLDLVVAVVVARLLFRHRAADEAGKRPAWPLVAGIMVYVFLTLRVSEPLYDAIPFLAANLWVWRVFFPMALLVVIFVTTKLGALPLRLRSDMALGALAALAMLQAAVFVVWHTTQELSTRRVALEEIEREVAVESRKTEGFGIDEYLPHPRMLPAPDEECRVVRTIVPEEGRYEMSFVIAAGDRDACIHVPRYWNVRYTASIDGEATPVYADAEGNILLVPEGRHGEARLQVARPPYVRLSLWLSGVAAVLLLIGVARSFLLPARLPRPGT